jgi:hypothetical protein
MKQGEALDEDIQEDIYIYLAMKSTTLDSGPVTELG